jgi:apolipoprotein N-acyltransferase
MAQTWRSLLRILKKGQIMTTIVVIAAIVGVVLAALYFALKGWRTIAANGASIGLIAAAEVISYLTAFDWKTIVPEQSAPLLVLIVSLLNIALRTITTTRVGEPAGPDQV